MGFSKKSTKTADLVKQLLTKPIQLADQVSKAAEGNSSFKQECLQLKSKTEKLASLLRQAATSSYDLPERPARRVIGDTEQVLKKTLALVLKSNGLIKRVFAIVPSAAFREISSRLENSIGDVSWLLRFSAPAEEGSYQCVGLPPNASNEPILCLIWEQLAILHNGSVDDRSDAAASLVSLLRDNELLRKLIIEEGGVGPLLKLIKEGNIESQVNAVKAIGLLGSDAESVDVMINAGVFFVFAKILKQGPMKVQAVVVWAVSEIVSKYPKCQDVFFEHNIVRLLVSRIAFETVQEYSHSSEIENCNTEPSSSLCSGIEDTESEADMKAMAVKALTLLAKDNSVICRSLIESSALLFLAILLEKGPEEVKYHSALALKEITAVAERDPELRRMAFEPNSPACKAVVNQVIDIIDKEDKRLLIPCVKTIGSLARTFGATEAKIIGLLVRLLDEREAEVSKVAADSLTKFACNNNYLHLDHSKAIISSGGAKHLVQLVYLGEPPVQYSALVLLSYITLNVPDSKELAQVEVLGVLEWASKVLVPRDETFTMLTLDETITMFKRFKRVLEITSIGRDNN